MQKTRPCNATANMNEEQVDAINALLKNADELCTLVMNGSSQGTMASALGVARAISSFRKASSR